ncbi:GreA/GreB family elongation factor [Muricoccus aerilatus]|uniref:GreA/GreB family elongation factor n=1 Tax=Muricoccus aerilatus TaxID=452982 RepID=UPI0005C20CDB|nr:GreA/GreB family elongation factor [Roseomonas aerilata]
MSRAFVREPDGSEPPEPLPERPVPPGPNPVTASGLARMEAELARLLALSAPGPMEQRDLHYWRQRRASAQLTAPPKGRAAGFGSWLTVAVQGAAPRRLRIVGEDEADPAAGLIGWRAPLAQALEGAEPGDEVEGPGGRILIVMAVENDGAD